MWLFFILFLSYTFKNIKAPNKVPSLTTLGNHAFIDTLSHIWNFWNWSFSVLANKLLLHFWRTISWDERKCWSLEELSYFIFFCFLSSFAFLLLHPLISFKFNFTLLPFLTPLWPLNKETIPPCCYCYREQFAFHD